MVWIPKMGECEICGEPIMMNSARQKYCDDCRKMMKKVRQQENREIEIARYVAKKRGRDPNRYAGKEHNCNVKGSCVYGGQKFCEYMTATGRSRITDGYLIRGGRCDAFKRGKRKVEKQMPEPSSPILKKGKMQEV